MSRSTAGFGRARAEEALIASENRYRTLFNSIDEGFCTIEVLFDRRGRAVDYLFLETNPAFLRQTGLADAVGRTVRELVPNHEEFWFETYGRIAMTGEAMRFEHEAAALGIFYDVYAFRIGAPGDHRVAVLFNNITERKRREANLAFLAEVTVDLAHLTTTEETMNELGAKIGRFFGVTQCMFAEHTDDFRTALVPYGWHARDAPDLRGTYRIPDFLSPQMIATLRTGQPLVVSDTQSDPRVRPERYAALGTRSFIVVPLVRDGEWRFQISVRHNEPRTWRADEVELMCEITARIWRRLEHARADDVLRTGAEQLRDADRRKDEFLAMLAHELRNPLAPIRTGLELIRAAGNTPAAVDNVRSMMERQVGHMVRLIDDLLDVSRITSGKIHLQCEPTPLASLVNSAVDACRAAILAKQIHLVVDLPDLPDTQYVLDVDPTRFVQIVSNLLHNATKFTNAGGTICVAARDVRSDDGRRELALSVSDTGVGIPADLLPRIFELFAQGAPATSQPGLGIGLALARRLVEMHGGRIDAHSGGPGEGSEFVIHLPLSTRTPQVEAAGPSTAIDCRVVVIDDNRDAATVMAMLVKTLGGQCWFAFDGESGLQEIRHYRPDVVLLDIGMAGMDGYETCRRIRRELGGDIAVVAVTGFGQDHDKEASARAGFDAHLTKPADPAALSKILAECDNKRQERRRSAGAADPTAAPPR
jgi:signal transduction histidine kinase/ActR/RegA family two-component response regulator